MSKKRSGLRITFAILFGIGAREGPQLLTSILEKIYYEKD